MTLLQSVYHKFLSFLFIFIFFLPSIVGAKNLYSALADSALRVLDREIDNRSTHRINKERALVQLKNTLSRASSNSLKFELCEDIYDEYSCYQFDSAFCYARKSYDIARLLEDSSAVHRSYLMIMGCFSSVGLLKESADIKNIIDTTYLSAADRLNFYRQNASLYTNLLSFLGNTSHIRKYYDACREMFTDKAIDACREDSTLRAVLSLERLTFSGLSASDELNRRLHLIEVNELPLHELAMQYCAMGKACISLDDIDAAVFYTAMSAICDQRICNNETMSTYILADLMHRKGDINRASKYIHAALDEANFFNSRLRKINTSVII